VDWYRTVIELIDMRSFSNIWFWIALAVLWSSLSHFILGVPFDMVTRARRHGGKTMEDLEIMVRIQVDRRLQVAQVSGPWLAGLGATVLTTLAMLGFYYGIQFGQALFLLMAPASLVGFMALRASARIAQGDLSGEALCSFLASYRFRVQLIGMAAIFVTAMWGMWQNMGVSVLNN